MRISKTIIAACGVLLATGATAGEGHFAASVRIGGAYVPGGFGLCGSGLVLYPPACGPVAYGPGFVISPYGAVGYADRYAGYAVHAYGDRVVIPRVYAYAHRGYDRYAYRYGQYHYPGRHYSYSYGYRFYDVHPHATVVIRGGHMRDYDHHGRSTIRSFGAGRSIFYHHAYRSRHIRTQRHHVVQRHVFRHGHHH